MSFFFALKNVWLLNILQGETDVLPEHVYGRPCFSVLSCFFCVCVTDLGYFLSCHLTVVSCF